MKLRCVKPRGQLVADNVVPFDPLRPRLPKAFASFDMSAARVGYDVAPLWVDAALTLGQLWRALDAAGLDLRSAGGGQGFIITKK